MIPLALRLAVAGGREALVRLVITAIGVALATGLLLLAAALFPALHSQQARAAWTLTSAHNVRAAGEPAAADPLLWRLTTDRFAGRPITWVQVAATGSRSPVPPGLSRLPGPGQLAVSPALRGLFRSVPAAMLRDRYPGRITETIGDQALTGPGQLIVVAGFRPAQLRGQPRVISVRGIESAGQGVPVTGSAGLVLAIAIGVLLIPVIVLVATAARLAAARREQRLAALRLIGATPRQIQVAAAAETALSAVAGTALGLALFALARPLAAGINLDGWAFFPADLRLSPLSAALVLAGVRR